MNCPFKVHSHCPQHQQPNTKVRWERAQHDPSLLAPATSAASPVRIATRHMVHMVGVTDFPDFPARKKNPLNAHVELERVGVIGDHDTSGAAVVALASATPGGRRPTQHAMTWQKLIVLVSGSRKPQLMHRYRAVFLARSNYASGPFLLPLSFCSGLEACMQQGECGERGNAPELRQPCGAGPAARKASPAPPPAAAHSRSGGTPAAGPRRRPRHRPCCPAAAVDLQAPAPALECTNLDQARASLALIMIKAYDP